MGEGSRPQHNKKQQPRKLHNTKGGTQRLKRRQSQNAGRNTTEKHYPEEPQQERNQGEDQKQTEGKESTAQNKQKQESRRGQDHEKASKRPTKQQQWEPITKQCQGLVAHGTEQVKKGHAKLKKGETKRELLRPDCKGDRIQPLMLCGMKPQFITFGLKGYPISLRHFLTKPPIGKFPFSHMLHSFWSIVSCD